MPAFAAALLAGAALVGFLPALPAPGTALALAAAAVAAAWAKPRARTACAFALGFALALAAAHERRHPTLTPALEGTDLVVEGRVSGLIERDGRRERFRFRVTHARRGGQPVTLPDTVRLAWYHADPPRVGPGERWRFTVRLKRPRGFQNPGGFDYERWLFLEGLGATGYVRPEPAPQRLALAFAPLDRARSELREAIRSAADGLENRGILQALTVGDRGAIAQDRWDTLIATGTNHLIAISGLHIGLAALLGFGLGRGVWRCAGRRGARLPAPIWQALCAMAVAVPYAALAGFALPTQRALVMLAAGLAAIVLRRRARPAEGMAAAAIAVLLLDPLAPLTAGFWLSFGAVGAILWLLCARIGGASRTRAWIRLQVGIAVVLAPLLIGFFGRNAMLSPVANLIAVPWVSFAVVPPALLGALLAIPWPDAATGAFTLADGALLGLWMILEPLAALPFAEWHRPPPPLWSVLLAALGAAWLLAPRGVPGKPAAAVLALPLVVWVPDEPQPGEVWLDVLDVGQALAVVVRTSGHTLVYDTGDRYSERFDAGSAVVVPFLRTSGVAHIDALVISHEHKDHAGGAPAVRGAFPPRRLWTSAPHRLGAPARFCGRDVSWRWDGVEFRFLHPDRDGAWLANDASCVLRVDAPGGSILLPGDIEAPAERALLERGAPLAADVVLVPHHGSASSSTPAFVDAVAPQWVLYSVGYRNRWDFPDADVLTRWRPAGLGRTDCGGALQVVLGPGAEQRPVSWRERYRRFWHAGCEDAEKSGTMRGVVGPVGAARGGG